MRNKNALIALLLSLGLLAAAGLSVNARQNYQPAADLEALHVPFDALLDMHVRDGLVYYRALQGDRARLNRYIGLLASTSANEYTSWNRDRQIAFWINAYNAFVLQTVVSHYPIRGTSKAYPANSIRQIPGAFDRVRHSAAGRSLTLDQIENTVLVGFNDPRIYLVLGRGAVGSGRLRSEAFAAARVDQQLAQSAQQFATSPRYVRVDALAGKIGVSPILSWRAASFIAVYADKSFDLPKRTPIELAIIGFMRPHLLAPEEAFIQKNTFQLDYLDFDWRLNDLTGGRPM